MLVYNLLPFLLLRATFAAAQQAEIKTVHTVFTTECNQYFNWQSLGIYHSFQKSKQPGPITRLLSCTEEQLKQYKDVDGIPTYHAPSWTIHPVTGDIYSGINKPVAVRDWLNKTSPKEDYILVIDSDTIMRDPFETNELDLRPGWAVSGFYGYLKGVKNELADKFLPNISPRNDSLAGPEGRKSDQVGGFAFMHREDLRRMSDEWVTITEDVRADPDAWKLSGDVYTKKPGDKPWIAEMYGYSYAAARANIWHHTSNKVMLYPGYTPLGVNESPNVLHYGVGFGISQVEPRIEYKFDKHWYLDFEPLNCHPWTKKDKEGRLQEGLFPMPPHPSQLTSSGLGLLTDLLVVETIATLNEALCLRHTRNCPPSTELDKACHEVYELVKAVTSAQKALAKAPATACMDEHTQCAMWAQAGECEKNPTYMEVNCKASCKRCKPLLGLPERAKEAPKKEAPKNKTPLNNQGVGGADATRVVDPKVLQDRMHSRGANAMAKAAESLKMKQDLLQQCFRDTRMSKAQVGDCMEAAKLGHKYEVPLRRHFLLEQGQALDGRAIAEDSSKRLKISEQRTLDKQRLGEMLRDGENEILEGDHKALIAFGVFLAFLLVVLRCCLPRRSQRYKGVRRD